MRPNPFVKPQDRLFIVNATIDRATDEERNRIRKIAFRSVINRAFLYTLPLFVSIPIVILGNVHVSVGNLVGLGHFSAFILLLYNALIILFLLVLIPKQSRLMRKRLAEQLVEHDIRPHFCVVCDYELKGATANLCPECGEPIALSKDTDNKD